MPCETPVMLAMVAVGAIAMTLELRMPTSCTLRRSRSQSSCAPVSASSQSVAALLLEHAHGVDGQDALGPEAALEAGVAAALLGQIAGGFNGAVADDLHGSVGEVHGVIRGVGDVHLVQGVLEAHQSQPHRPVPEVGAHRLRHRVVVQVDDVVQHAHGGF